jgi:hypothetical protein
LLPVQKPGTEDFKPIEDLWSVNSATVTLPPTVPNPYMLLGFVPAEAKFFTCLDLKDAFFCILLAPRVSPFLPSDGKSQHWGKGTATGFQKFTYYFWNCLSM